jgi:hypothetical protein
MSITQLQAGNTLLTYMLATSPAPLQASPEAGPPAIGDLQFVISNPLGAPAVTVAEILFMLPIGDPSHPDASDLTDTAAGIQCSVSASGTNLWQIGPGPSGGQFALTPQAGQSGVVSSQGLIVTISGIQVSGVVGTAVMMIGEQASSSGAPSQKRSSTFSIPKFPYGFAVDNFTANAPMVDDGGCVVLTWIGSVGAAYTLLWGSQNVNVSKVNTWTSPALTDNTTFILQVSAQEAGQTVTYYNSVTVIVQDPDITATTINVLGTSVLGGAVSAAASLSVAGNLTVGEGAQSQYMLDAANGWTRIGAYNTQSVPQSNGLGGMVVGWNRSSGNAETNLYNVYANATTAFQFSQINGATFQDLVTILGNGNVGVGTTSPQATFSVAGSTALAGALSVSGPVAMMSAATMLAQGTSIAQTGVVAQTDGFAVVQVLIPGDNGKSSFAYGQIYASGNWFSVLGGTVGSFGSGWGDVMDNNPNAITIPIQSGSTWYYAGSNPDGSQMDSPIQIWWFPLGGASGEATYRILEDGEHTAPPPPPELKANRAASRGGADRAAFITILERLLDNPIDEPTRQQLLALGRL